MMRAVAVLAVVAATPAMASAQATPRAGMAPARNIVQVATDAGTFTTLIAAVKAAGLEGTLEGPGPFTVFAPTDAAFAKLPPGTVEALLADRAKLASILTYHVVSGRVMAGDLVRSKGAMPATVNGRPLDIAVRGGKVYVNGVNVVTADVQASNGVVHVIDAVLLPPAADAAPAGR
jgi:uncharacterized surface protein with fasciclin (FAS1) repeats